MEAKAKRKEKPAGMVEVGGCGEYLAWQRGGELRPEVFAEEQREAECIAHAQAAGFVDGVGRWEELDCAVLEDAQAAE